MERRFTPSEAETFVVSASIVRHSEHVPLPLAQYHLRHLICMGIPIGADLRMSDVELRQIAKGIGEQGTVYQFKEPQKKAG